MLGSTLAGTPPDPRWEMSAKCQPDAHEGVTPSGQHQPSSPAPQSATQQRRRHSCNAARPTTQVQQPVSQQQPSKSQCAPGPHIFTVATLTPEDMSTDYTSCCKRVLAVIGCNTEHKPRYAFPQDPCASCAFQQRQRQRGVFTSVSDEADSAQPGQEAAACPRQTRLAEVPRLAAGGHLRRGACMRKAIRSTLSCWQNPAPMPPCGSAPCCCCCW